MKVEVKNAIRNTTKEKESAAVATGPSSCCFGLSNIIKSDNNKLEIKNMKMNMETDKIYTQIKLFKLFNIKF